MIILGIETSTQVCAVALTDSDALIAEFRLNIKNVHASALLALISSLLQQSSVALANVAAIAVSIGPGSFTGLRIGLSAAKGLALGRSIPIVTVPTLPALASNALIASGIICPILKSRTDEYYAAVYERSFFVDSIRQDVRLLKKDEMSTELPQGALLIGQVGDFLQDEMIKRRFTFAPAHLALPTAFSIARLGYEKYKSGDLAVYETVEPLYVQNFVAGKPKSSVV